MQIFLNLGTVSKRSPLQPIYNSVVPLVPGLADMSLQAFRRAVTMLPNLEISSYFSSSLVTNFGSNDRTTVKEPCKIITRLYSIDQGPVALN